MIIPNQKSDSSLSFITVPLKTLNLIFYNLLDMRIVDCKPIHISLIQLEFTFYTMLLAVGMSSCSIFNQDIIGRVFPCNPVFAYLVLLVIDKKWFRQD